MAVTASTEVDEAAILRRQRTLGFGRSRPRKTLYKDEILQNN